MSAECICVTRANEALPVQVVAEHQAHTYRLYVKQQCCWLFQKAFSELIEELLMQGSNLLFHNRMPGISVELKHHANSTGWSLAAHT